MQTHHTSTRQRAQRVSAIMLVAIISVLSISCAHAVSPDRWDITIQSSAPHNLDIWRGESLDLRPRFLSYGAPWNISTAATITLYWSTNNFATAPWATNGVLLPEAGRVSVTWSPACDAGAATYQYFVGVSEPSGLIYRARGTIRMQASPGFVPSTAPLPVWDGWTNNYTYATYAALLATSNAMALSTHGASNALALALQAETARAQLAEDAAMSIAGAHTAQIAAINTHAGAQSNINASVSEGMGALTGSVSAVRAALAAGLVDTTNYVNQVCSTNSGSLDDYIDWIGDIFDWFPKDQQTTNLSVGVKIPTISASKEQAIGLTSGGSVMTTPPGTFGYTMNVSGWSNVISIAGGHNDVIGIIYGGRVVAAGKNEYGQHAVSDWFDIVSAGINENFSVGVKSDGTVIGVGRDEQGSLTAVKQWTNIKAISTTWDHHVIGMRSNGTAVIEGFAGSVAHWTNLVAVAAGGQHALGLQADGHVVSTTTSYQYGQTNVYGWSNIVAISAHFYQSLGLKADGTVVRVGKEDDSSFSQIGTWSNIVAIACSLSSALGLKSDGTVVFAGNVGDTSFDDVLGWHLNGTPFPRSINFNPTMGPAGFLIGGKSLQSYLDSKCDATPAGIAAAGGATASSLTAHTNQSLAGGAHGGLPTPAAIGAMSNTPAAIAAAGGLTTASMSTQRVAFADVAGSLAGATADALSASRLNQADTQAWVTVSGGTATLWRVEATTNYITSTNYITYLRCDNAGSEVFNGLYYADSPTLWINTTNHIVRVWRSGFDIWNLMVHPSTYYFSGIDDSLTNAFWEKNLGIGPLPVFSFTNIYTKIYLNVTNRYPLASIADLPSLAPYATTSALAGVSSAATQAQATADAASATGAEHLALLTALSGTQATHAAQFEINRTNAVDPAYRAISNLLVRTDQSWVTLANWNLNTMYGGGMQGIWPQSGAAYIYDCDLQEVMFFDPAGRYLYDVSGDIVASFGGQFAVGPTGVEYPVAQYLTNHEAQIEVAKTNWQGTTTRSYPYTGGPLWGGLDLQDNSTSPDFTQNQVPSSSPGWRINWNTTRYPEYGDLVFYAPGDAGRWVLPRLRLGHVSTIASVESVNSSNYITQAGGVQMVADILSTAIVASAGVTELAVTNIVLSVGASQGWSTNTAWTWQGAQIVALDTNLYTVSYAAPAQWSAGSNRHELLPYSPTNYGAGVTGVVTITTVSNVYLASISGSWYYTIPPNLSPAIPVTVSSSYESSTSAVLSAWCSQNPIDASASYYAYFSNLVVYTYDRTGMQNGQYTNDAAGIVARVDSLPSGNTDTRRVVNAESLASAIDAAKPDIAKEAWRYTPSGARQPSSQSCTIDLPLVQQGQMAYLQSGNYYAMSYQGGDWYNTTTGSSWRLGPGGRVAFEVTSTNRMLFIQSFTVVTNWATIDIATNWITGAPYVEFCADLAYPQWLAAPSQLVTSNADFWRVQCPASATQRFYRAVSPGGANAINSYYQHNFPEGITVRGAGVATMPEVTNAVRAMTADFSVTNLISVTNYTRFAIDLPGNNVSLDDMRICAANASIGSRRYGVRLFRSDDFRRTYLVYAATNCLLYATTSTVAQAIGSGTNVVNDASGIIWPIDMYYQDYGGGTNDWVSYTNASATVLWQCCTNNFAAPAGSLISRAEQFGIGKYRDVTGKSKLYGDFTPLTGMTGQIYFVASGALK